MNIWIIAHDNNICMGKPCAIYIYIYITSVLTIKLKHILVQQYCFGKKIDLLDLRKIYI